MCLPKILSPVFMFAFIFHCPSFSPCWPLTFLTVSQLLWIFMFFFLQNSSLLFSTIRFCSFFQITSKKTRLCCCFSLSKSLGSYAIFFPNKTLSYIWVAIPVDWIILHWYACGADRRSGGRCTVTWLPNFLGWAVYHISLPMVLRCALRARELRYDDDDVGATRNKDPSRPSWAMHAVLKSGDGFYINDRI